MSTSTKFRDEAAAIKEQIEITDKQIAAAEETAAEIDRDLPRLSLADEKAAKEAITARSMPSARFPDSPKNRPPPTA